MDNRKKLEELKIKFEELREQYLTARGDVMNLEGTKEYEEYNALASDEERKEKSPEIYAMYKKEAELSEKVEALERDISELSKDISEGLAQAILALEAKINEMQEQRKALEEETARIKSELVELKKDAAYLSGDKDAVKTVEELEAKLRKITTAKGNLTKKINSFTNEIENIKQEQYDLEADFVEDTIEEEEIITTSNPEVVVQDEVTANVEEEAKDNKPLTSEEVEQILRSAYAPVNYAEDLDAEQEYINSNIFRIRMAIKVGKIKPEFLTSEMLYSFINDGIDFTRYNEYVKEQQTNKEEEFKEKQKEVKGIVNNIKIQEDKIVELKNQYDKVQAEVQELNKEIYALKATEEFKNGDKDTVEKIKTLEMALNAKTVEKIKLAKKITEIRNDINDLEAKKNDIIAQYGEKVLEYAVVESVLPERPVIMEHKKEVRVPRTIEPNNEENQPNKVQPKVTSQSKQQQGKTFLDNDTRFTTFPSGNEIRHSASKTQEELENTEKREAELQKKHDEKLKKEFVRLYSQAKRGALTELDYSKLTMIMGNPEYYEKLGITTGVVFNKARVILKAMALTAADTKKTATRSKKILGLAVEKASKANGYMPTGDVKEWRGLKKLAENPEQKIAGEELCKKIVELDCRWFNKEQLEVVDAAKRHLKKFEALRTATSAYKQVVDSRTKAKLSWIVEFEEEKKEVLPAAQAEQNGTLATNSLGLEALVNDIIDEDSIPPRVNSKGEPTQEK